MDFNTTVSIAMWKSVFLTTVVAATAGYCLRGLCANAGLVKRFRALVKALIAY